MAGCQVKWRKIEIQQETRDLASVFRYLRSRYTFIHANTRVSVIVWHRTFTLSEPHEKMARSQVKWRKCDAVGNPARDTWLSSVFRYMRSRSTLRHVNNSMSVILWLRRAVHLHLVWTTYKMAGSQIKWRKMNVVENSARDMWAFKCLQVCEIEIYYKTW